MVVDPHSWGGGGVMKLWRGWGGMMIGAIPDQIDNERRPRLAPGRTGWEGNLKVRRKAFI